MSASEAESGTGEQRPPRAGAHSWYALVAASLAGPNIVHQLQRFVVEIEGAAKPTCVASLATRLIFES